MEHRKTPKNTAPFERGDPPLGLAGKSDQIRGYVVNEAFCLGFSFLFQKSVGKKKGDISIVSV